MSRIVRIGAATAFFNDSRMGVTQLLRKARELDYIVFDFLSESVMGGLGRGLSGGTGPGYGVDFARFYIRPHLRELLDRGIRVIANAGGLAPEQCAAFLREEAAAIGLSPRIGVVSGDNLTGRVDTLVDPDTRDMFDGSPVADAVRRADRVDSLVAYSGAFPIAAALGAGADIVLTGRAVDSALTLGALIHEFGWGAGDFDRLAAGTLAGHLLECSAQVTGGTFTDWREVADWAGIGMPVGECSEDGGLVITKPEGTGGLVSVGTVAEQLLYEVSDPQRYVVPDVVVDFTGVTLEQLGPDRVALRGVRGLGRTGSLKASLCYDSGWRGSALIPVIGAEAGAKARRMGGAILERSGAMLREAQLPPFTRTLCDVIGGEPDGAPAICRLLVDHPDREGAELMVREQSSAISHMSVGTTLGLGSTVRPLQRIAGFLLPKESVSLRVTLDGTPVPWQPANAASEGAGAAEPPPLPPPPERVEPEQTVPLIRLAWGRSGDKGNLFNVAVIARRPEFLPFIAAALTPERVGAWYGERLGQDRTLPVQRFPVPGFSALNFVVGESMDGGILASTYLDPVAKGMAQLLLSMPIPVTREIRAALDATPEAQAAPHRGGQA